jgi:hypothetical protein
MNSASKRSYRKNLITNGLIYVNGEEREVAVSNMSMTGVLARLNSESDAETAFNDSLVSTIIDFYLPKLSLAGTAEIVRVTREDTQISLALKFKDITYNIDSLLYKRKVYRKNMSVPGRILLNSEYYSFQTVNVSVEGLMVRLAETVVIAEGMTTSFEFKDLSLKGEVEVMWIDFDAEGKTLVGLKYIHVNADGLEGIPRFSTTDNS